MKLNKVLWLKISILNLLFVALLGLLMRYKIAFEFPYFNQKNLQNSHSHFAFAGWISHTLMVLMIIFLERKIKNNDFLSFKKYNSLLIINLICCYGMLISFIFTGYGLLSIFFSTVTIIIACVFTYFYSKDLKLVSSEELAKNWFIAALFFNILSSFGTFALAYMMFTKTMQQEEYLASIYFYLHFQYNGWFFFACMGLLLTFLNLKISDSPYLTKIFWLSFASCLPAYFLSTLWLKLPLWVYVLTVLAALVQTFAWFKFLLIASKHTSNTSITYPKFLRYIFYFVALAISLKFMLQLGSTIPALSQLAFGFRPIVIAYLHLVLLAGFSLFLLFYMYANRFLNTNKGIGLGLTVFAAGVLINELVLAIQGIAYFSYTLIPFVNEVLFGVALILVTGILITVFYSLQKVNKQ